MLKDKVDQQLFAKLCPQFKQYSVYININMCTNCSYMLLQTIYYLIKYVDIYLNLLF